MATKKPLLIDLVYGIVGTFIRQQEYQQGYVHIFYVPLDCWKEVQYPEVVPIKAILTINPTRPDIAGVSADVKVIVENAKGEAFFKEQMGEIFTETLKRVEDEREREKMSAWRNQHLANKYAKETEKQKALDNQLNKSDREQQNRFSSPFGNRFMGSPRIFGGNNNDDNNEYE